MDKKSPEDRLTVRLSRHVKRMPTLLYSLVQILLGALIYWSIPIGRPVTQLGLALTISSLAALAFFMWLRLNGYPQGFYNIERKGYGSEEDLRRLRVNDQR